MRKESKRMSRKRQRDVTEVIFIATVWMLVILVLFKRFDNSNIWKTREQLIEEAEERAAEEKRKLKVVELKITTNHNTGGKVVPPKRVVIEGFHVYDTAQQVSYDIDKESDLEFAHAGCVL